MQYPVWMKMLPFADEANKGGGGGSADDKEKEAKKTPEEEWDAFLAGLSEDMRKKFETQTSGLKSALISEREKSKGVADKLKRLADLEADEAKRKESELSEAQKATAKLAELEKELADRDEKLATTTIRHAVELEASKQGFQSAEDAYLMADLDEVKITEDGKVTGAEAALKALAKAKPYLLKTGKPGGAPEIDSGRKSTTGQPAEELKENKRREYGRL